MSEPELLSIHLRAFTEESAEQAANESDASEQERRPHRWREPGFMPAREEREVLIFDTETSTEIDQTLSFGVWRLCREILTEDGLFARLAVREEGILVADDLAERDRGAYETLERYTQAHEPAIDPRRHWIEPVMECATGLVLRPRAWFCEDRIFKCAYKRKVPVVGFNLPFDLSRIAVGWRPARGRRWGGGFALIMRNYTDRSALAKPVEKPHPFRPTVNVKPIDGARALIGFGSRRKPDRQDADEHGYPYRGEFIDLRALGLGLTGEKHSLASACRAMRAGQQKPAAAEHGKLTDDYIDYARQDVAATQALYEACRRELERHPISVPAHRVLSPAGIGKGYLKAMGVRPRLDLQPDFPRDVLGAAASSYYGGRVEAHLIGSAPVRYLDVLSMYPTVNALMGLWRLVTCDLVNTREATETVQTLLDRVSMADVMAPERWPAFVGIAKLAAIDPAHPPALPLRAVYGAGGTPTIAVNALANAHDGWYAIPDLVASKLLTGRAPQVERAIIFEGQGAQPVQPVYLRGEVEIDAARRDFFAALIEERQRIKRKPEPDTDDSWRSQALKITANSTSYGITMEMLRDESTVRPTGIDVHTGAESFQTLSSTPESPRHYCFPPLASLITAGARLVLAAIETQVAQAGGQLAYMDTDSAAIVSTQAGGRVRCGAAEIEALPWAAVDEIAARFTALNPYDPEIAGGSILELEAENIPEREGEDEQLHLYLLGSKRYAMYKLAADGTVIVRKCSEHGLGLRLDPTVPAAPVSSSEGDGGALLSPGQCAHRAAHPWIVELWVYLIEHDALGRDVPEPAWFGRPALYKATISTPELARRLKLAPFNFVLCAQPLSVQGARSELRLIAPFESDPQAWGRMRFLDARTGTEHKIRTGEFEGYATDEVFVKSYRNIAAEFLSRPESKLASTGGRTGVRRHRGLLVRRNIAAGETVAIGKEGNHLDMLEVGLLRGDEVLNRYAPASVRGKTFDTHIRPVMQAFTVAAIVKATGIPERSVREICAGSTPHHKHERPLTEWAARAARGALRDAGKHAPSDRRSVLLAWARLAPEQRGGARPCECGCGEHLTGRERKYKPGHESKARRKRAATAARRAKGKPAAERPPAKQAKRTASKQAASRSTPAGGKEAVKRAAGRQVATRPAPTRTRRTAQR